MRKPTPRGVGLVGAMTESVAAMQTDLRQAKEKIEGGDLIIEVATDLIDPSFIADRIGEDEDMEAFVASIRDQGQRTPILLRPHPDIPRQISDRVRPSPVSCAEDARAPGAGDGEAAHR